MGEFRTVEQIRALPDLRPQEEELLEKAEAGELLTLGDGELPSAGDKTRSIRAGIIRYLLLGGCEGLRCHEKGVHLQGAWVPDVLDLTWCTSDRALSVFNSRLSEAPMLVGATLRAIFLDGTHCSGIMADRIRVTENLHLKGKFEALGVVRLAGARIGGNFSCNDATFSNENHDALNADGVKVGGDILLSGNFRAKGEVRLLGAEVGGNLNCKGATILNKNGRSLNADGLSTAGSVFLDSGFNAEGEVRLVRAQIGGDLACVNGSFCNENGNALCAHRARVSGSLLWYGGVKVMGHVGLNGASCAELIDDLRDWPDQPGSLSLSGFTYGSIGGSCVVEAELRLDWLARDDVLNGFRPQPYQQLAKVLREMGHANDARKVMVKKEELQWSEQLTQSKLIRAALQQTALATEDQSAAQENQVKRFRLSAFIWWSPKWNFLFRRLVGYGYYPFNSFWAGLGLFLFAAALFSATWLSGPSRQTLPSS